MLKKRRKKALEEGHTNNIWNRHDFVMCGLGEKSRTLAIVKHIRRCIKWSKQRIVRGYADSDIWNMYGYLQVLLPDMLEFLKNHRFGSPGYLGENYTNEDGILMNDTCHEVWDKILDRMIFLWRETDEETCSKQNPYEEEYRKALDEFRDKYGVLGKKLQTPEELEANRKRGGGGTVHFMSKLPEYKEISEKYMQKADVEYILVDYWKRYPKEAFDAWYKNQNRFRNAEDREKVRDIVEGSMRMPEMARMLGVSRSVVYNIIACSDILKTIELDGRRRVTKESFYEWYASQDRYHIVSEQAPETVKKEDNRSIETYRRAVQDRDGHTKNIGNDAYLTVKEAALLAGINPATVHKWIKKGKIEAVQSSKTVRIPRQAFENWLQSRKKEDQHGINC